VEPPLWRTEMSDEEFMKLWEMDLKKFEKVKDEETDYCFLVNGKIKI
jgi:hypothetical protein